MFNIDILIRLKIANITEIIKFTGDQKQAGQKDNNDLVYEKFRYRDSIRNNKEMTQLFEAKWNFNESSMPSLIDKGISEVLNKPVYVDRCNLLIAYISYEKLVPIICPGIGK